MNTKAVFASEVRVTALLAALAVLLPGCGGSTPPDMQARTAGSAQASPGSAALTPVATPQQISQLYRELLGRDPDQAGLKFWSQAAANGLPLDAIATEMKNSPEYRSSEHLFVAANGKSSNPGTMESPVDTIDGAENLVRNGKSHIIHVGPGTYNVKPPVQWPGALILLKVEVPLPTSNLSPPKNMGQKSWRRELALRG